MKQFLHSYRLFLIVAALCTLSAFWLLGVRIGVEQTQRQVDVVVSYEDVCALSDASGIPVQDWLTQLADAGARELLVTPAELADPDIVRAAQDAGLGTAQAGGLAQGGTYFFAARYDTLAAAGQTGIDTDTEPLAQAQVLDALRESGSTLVLIEDRNQTGCVLPDGYSLDGYTGSMVKGFWLNQTFRARYQTLGYSGAEEIVNMLYRAVVDRGTTVLWLTPLTDAAGETVAQPEVYTQLLQDLAQRIAPAGYSYGAITGIPAKTVSPVLLMLCGIGGGVGAALLGYQKFAHVKKRVAIWLDPWSDYDNAGYQLIQSLMAIASGGVLGVGLGLGSPTTIPVYHTDFIFSVICEQFGMLFGSCVLLMYVAIIWRGTSIAMAARTRFHGLLAMGCTAMIGLQTFIIIGGVIKLIPLTGVTMPFVSYGGTSLVACLCLIGLIQGVSSVNEDDLARDADLADYGGGAA